MANDINISNPSGLTGTAQRPVSSQTSGTDRNGSATGSAVSSDRVSVTNEATRLRAIEEQLMAVPDVNAGKVAEIRQAIANGTFEVNPLRTAEKLLAFESGSDK